MTNKEISIRSIMFLIIGLLLVLSLVICIHIVNNEKDLVPIKATVIKIKDDKDATGKNDVTVVYEVNNTTYQYNFYYKDDIKVDDEISIFYHEKDITSVQTRKTSKLIFICPIIGILLCVLGLFELFTKHKVEEEDSIKDYVNSKVIDEDDKTQTIKILAEGEKSTYKETEEEAEEVPVKNIKTKLISTDYISDDDNNTMQIDDLVGKVKKELQKEKKYESIKIIPSEYKIDKDLIRFKEKGKELQELSINEIEKIIKTINSEKELVKITIKKENYTYIFTSMPSININRFADELHEIIKKKQKGILEEIEYKEW